MDATSRIASVDDVPADSTLVFRIRPSDGDGTNGAAVDGGTAGDGTASGTAGDGTVSGTAGDGTASGTAADGSTHAVREAILVRTGDAGEADSSIAAWLNACQHFTHVPLDKGSGATMRGDEIVCENHGAYFEADSGRCTYGPCEGAVLPAVDVTVDDGAVYLVDEDHELVGVGPLEDDGDLVSDSNVEF